MRQLVYTSLLLITTLCFRCAERKIFSNAKKFQDIMKTIVCTFFLFFMTLLTALTVEDSRILAGIYFIFLERVIDQT